MLAAFFNRKLKIGIAGLSIETGRQLAEEAARASKGDAEMTGKVFDQVARQVAAVGDPLAAVSERQSSPRSVTFPISEKVAQVRAEWIEQLAKKAAEDLEPAKNTSEDA